MSKIKKLGVILILGILGVISGTALQPATADSDSGGYCESDVCKYQTFCEPTIDDTGCDRLFDGSCFTYDCNLARL